MNKIIRFSQLLMLILWSCASVAQNSIDIKGFGEVTYTKNNDKLSVNIPNYGTYDFEGSIEPLNLYTTVDRSQLEKLPNYQLIEALELEDISLQLTAEQFSFTAKANTENKLKNLCEALHISAPFLDFKGAISSNAIALESELDFSESPVVVNFTEEKETRLTLENVGIRSISTVGGASELSLGVFSKGKIKPTSFDPDLNSSLQLKYDLVTMELSGTGTMSDKWSDPVGLSHYTTLKEDAVSLSNAIISIGWVPGSSAPTSLGFVIEEGNFFDMQFLSAISVSLTKKDVALKALNNEMDIDDFLKSLEKGFGVKIPRKTFPKDVVLQDIALLFSPSGGNVDSFQIEKGLLYQGGVAFSDKVSGNIAFYTSGKDSLLLDMNLNTKELNALIKAEIAKNKDTELKKLLEQAIDNVEIEKVLLHLEGDKKQKLTGNTECKLVLFEKPIHFEWDGRFTLENIMSNLIKKIGMETLNHFKERK